MTSKQALNVRLLTINCYRQDENDGDEIFLSIDSKKFWPTESKFIKIQEGSETVNVELNNIQRDSNLTIELWDFDFLSPNDKLGEFSMLVNERGGPFNTDMSIKESKTAKYSLTWEVY